MIAARLGALAAGAALALALAGPARAGPAVPAGSLTQLPPPRGCVSEDGTGGACTRGAALGGAVGVAVSPDGRGVYVASVTSDAVAALARAADGSLTELGCVSEDGTGGACARGTALDGAFNLAVSPDGRNVYVAASASDAVVAFARAADGSLAELGCVSEDGTGGACTTGTALEGAADVAVSPDGRTVYVASFESDAVVAFARAADGSLSELGCVSEDGSGGACTDGTALVGAVDVAVGPDGGTVYVASFESDAVVALDREGDGSLAVLGCVSEDGSGGACVDGNGLDGAVGVAVSPDGRIVYVASYYGNAAASFARSADGSLSELGCVSEGGTGPCAGGSGLEGAEDVAVSPDGRSVYVTSELSDAVAAFARRGDGSLAQVGCVSADGSSGACAPGIALDVPEDVAVSPDGRNVYSTSWGSDAVLAFARAVPAGGVEAGFCDPLSQICAPAAPAASGPPPLAPHQPAGSGPAVGKNRMPDLSVRRLRAVWAGSVLHVLVRIGIARPRLARPFDVSVSGRDFHQTLRVRPRSRSRVTLEVGIPLARNPVGTRVVARLDPGEELLEARERNNRAVARIRARS